VIVAELRQKNGSGRKSSQTSNEAAAVEDVSPNSNSAVSRKRCRFRFSWAARSIAIAFALCAFLASMRLLVC
jgi:hypothetical protein